jgi:hypothetical protein
MATLQGCIRPSLRSVAFRSRARLIIFFNDLIVHATTSLVERTDEGFPAIALRNRLKADPVRALLRWTRARSPNAELCIGNPLPPAQWNRQGPEPNAAGLHGENAPTPKTTCRPLLQSPDSNPTSLPRFADTLKNCHSTTNYASILPDRAGPAKAKKNAKSALCHPTSARSARVVGWPRMDTQEDRGSTLLFLPLRIFLRFPGLSCPPNRSLLCFAGLGSLGSDPLLEARLPLIPEFLHGVAGGRFP